MFANAHSAFKIAIAGENGGLWKGADPVFQYAFLEELFEDVADSLHDFLMISSLRVSRMKRPINSIFSATERLRWLARQLGMPRDGEEDMG